MIKLFLNQFTDETVNLSLTVLVLLTVVLIAYWYYNRRKFHKLTHQIPASVVKNYLDSIIANSNALKSSLFRGGGLEVGEGIPSILPTSDLPVGGAGGSELSEELAQKNAEIATLRTLVNQKDNTIAELEKMLAAAKSSGGGGVSQEEVDILNNEIATLKNQLEEANIQLEDARLPAGEGGSDADLMKERDELKERLMEYEIIEEDLANLKRYQQENEELKKTIAELKGGAATPAAEVAEDATPEPEPQAEPEPEAEVAQEPSNEPAAEAEPEAELAASEPVAPEPEAEAPSEETAGVPANTGEQKSAEELLSEFEKMLG